ncbi:hypothetical protein ACH42_17510 [Endozoicomonas sp. (ex Bugula neritina AB1)]|nr:hypothetical protein ACH42_17510 [Endozoicomonas sp. (ex Bugula neritina AB1)]
MIKPLQLSSLESSLNGQLHGQDQVVRGGSIDTRTLKQGDLFVAIEGARFDGHGYLEQAQTAGAVAAVTHRFMEGMSLPQIVVADTGVALGQLGALNRDFFQGTLMGVTGSCGKTSVKEMLLSIFSEQDRTMATEGNFNNEFGVPLTLFRIEAEDRYAVIELGTSSPGEIDYIARMSRPDIALITNADETHLADLINVEGVAQEKGYILDALSPEGIAVLNLDDHFFKAWEQRAQKSSRQSVVSFSFSDSKADCYASGVQTTSEGMTFTLHLREQERLIHLSFWGKHQVLNACSAAAVALAAHLPLDIIVQGLENARPYQRRGQRFSLPSGAMLIDETYNANPRATLAAIDQLADCKGRTVMVLGDMLDLGEVSDARHQEVGEYAQQCGVDEFLSFGPSAKIASTAFGEGRHFHEKGALIDWLHSNLAEDVTVLVKGSRGMKMLDVIRALAGSDYKGEA